ncbi:metal-sensing transcriptional repressor [Filomicrobium sp.]|uniref:metal-sensing transcriptional repressor n=1 Tax=Filomicrobium sp. TaxID=2024831 RepID=UPI00338F85F5|nr:metal-sensing transcriptional repressor [Filomicrobium sp.]
MKHEKRKSDGAKEIESRDRNGHRHQSHPGIIRRLRRAEGHLRSVIAMIEEGRACLDVAPQLQAVEQALANAKVEFIRDHIDHCLGEAGSSAAHQVVNELKAITKYL